MKNMFSVNEMAKLNNISPRNLRYYDEIGLVKACCYDKTNGYRYYSINKFEELDFIKYLRYLNVPIKEIKKHLSVKNLDAYQAMLFHHLKETDKKIKTLQGIKRKIRKRMDDVMQVKAIDEFGIVTVRKIVTRCALRINGIIETDEQLNMILSGNCKKENIDNNIFVGNVALVMAKENLINHKYGIYSSILVFTDSDNKAANSMLCDIDGGLYACIYFRGNHTMAAKYYEMIIEYAAENKYVIKGDAIERTIINQYISKEPKDYVTEIQIPVGKIR